MDGVCTRVVSRYQELIHLTTHHTHIQHRTDRDERDSKEWLTKVLQVFVAQSTSGDSTIVFRLRMRAFGYNVRKQFRFIPTGFLELT